tara:strand:- start:364 stop:681 length:318 start_codon:yes stop_codon:yes gene_type:complete
MAPYIFIRQAGHSEDYQITTDLEKNEAKKLMQDTLKCFETSTSQNTNEERYSRGENPLIEKVNQIDSNSRSYFTEWIPIESQYTLKSNRPFNQMKLILQKGLRLI